MKNFTNKMNFPEPFVLALQASAKKYDNGGSWRTVTQLIDPPKAVVLRNFHSNEIVEDVADRVYSFDGQIGHGILELAAGELKGLGWESERRLFATVNDRKVSGQFDLYNSGTGQLIDFKNTGVYGLKKKPIDKKWEEQTNLLAALLRREGGRINEIGILVKARDYRGYEAEAAKMKGEYYPAALQYIKYPVWTPEQAESFLLERVKMHIAAELELPYCNAEDRWQSESIWFVKKKKNKTASGAERFFTESDALKALAAAGSDYELLHVAGKSGRCEKYCQAAPWCDQFKQMKQGEKK